MFLQEFLPQCYFADTVPKREFPLAAVSYSRGQKQLHLQVLNLPLECSQLKTLDPRLQANSGLPVGLCVCMCECVERVLFFILAAGVFFFFSLMVLYKPWTASPTSYCKHPTLSEISVRGGGGK